MFPEIQIHKTLHQLVYAVLLTYPIILTILFAYRRICSKKLTKYRPRIDNIQRLGN